ncbi:MAG TPA: hypothetical protein VMT61_19170 [Candidatus Binataceae bacterium]|nr:hypothetical protein [Candidatus Binataceae bacterium]
MEKVLYPGRARLLTKSLIGLVTALVAISLAATGSGLGWFILVVCLFSVPPLLINAIPGACLLALDKDGFTIRSLFKERRYRWADVECFVVVTVKHMGLIPVSQQVGFYFSENYKRSRAMKVATGLARAMVKFDAALPDRFGMKPRELANQMETWRQGAWVNSLLSDGAEFGAARQA